MRHGLVLKFNNEESLPKTRSVSADVPSAEYQASAGSRGVYTEIRLDDEEIDGCECS